MEAEEKEVEWNGGEYEEGNLVFQRKLIVIVQFRLQPKNQTSTSQIDV